VNYTTGKVVSGRNLFKGKLDPERISAIINQINIQFSYFMTKKVNSDKLNSGQKYSDASNIPYIFHKKQQFLKNIS
jgi:hypothetical protein